MTQQNIKRSSERLGAVLAGVSIAVLCALALSSILYEPSVISQHDPKDVTLRDVKALRTKIERLQNSMREIERLLPEMKRELTGFRSQLAQVDQRQQAIAHDIERTPGQGTMLDGENSEAPIWDDEADISVLTPEEESARAEAQTKLQLDLLESMLLEEEIDPQWASVAQLSVAEVFQGEEIAGVQLVNVECRTTLCRIELSLDGSTSPEDSFRNLIHIRPWQGQSFARTDHEGDYTEVYLVREGHSLPQSME